MHSRGGGTERRPFQLSLGKKKREEGKKRDKEEERRGRGREK